MEREKGPAAIPACPVASGSAPAASRRSTVVGPGHAEVHAASVAQMSPAVHATSPIVAKTSAHEAIRILSDIS